MYKVTNKNVYKYDDMKRAEHMAVRNTVGWYLWTHQLLEVCGKDAAAILDKVYIKPIADLGVSRDRYTAMVDEDGLIIDDVVVLRLAEDKFWVSTLYVYKLMDWLEKYRGDLEFTCEDVSKKWRMYAVQGPKAKEMVDGLIDGATTDDMKFFQMLDFKVAGIDVKINRAGFTGEKIGYEIYVPVENAKPIVDLLAERAKQFDGKKVEEFQIMALSLPTERGFYLLCDIMWANPFEVGLDKGINWEREFVGKEALLKVQAEGPTRELIGFIADEDDVHIQSKDRGGPGDAILLNGEEVGRATKWTYSYLLEKNIGYALVEKGVAKIGDRVTINDNPATLVEKPFA